MPHDQIPRFSFRYPLEPEQPEKLGSQASRRLTKGRLQVNFSATILSGLSPFQTNFRDESIGKTKAWLWDFGDGQTSRERNPIHIYSDAGVYNVTLKAWFADGTAASHTKISYISVVSVPTFVCELTSYPWEQVDPYNPWRWWEINIDGTLHAENLIKGDIIFLRRISVILDQQNGKYKVKIVYHNDSNSFISINLYTQTNQQYSISLSPSVVTANVYINTEALLMIRINSRYIEDLLPPGEVGEEPNTQNWIECFQVISHDWTGEEPYTAIYV